MSVKVREPTLRENHPVMFAASLCEDARKIVDCWASNNGATICIFVGRLIDVYYRC